MVYLCLLPGLFVSGQVPAVGAESVSLAGVSAVLENTWSVVNNPAGLGRPERPAIAMGTEEKFMMKELGQYSLAAAIPVKAGGFGLSAIFSGYSLSLNQELRLGYGRFFGRHLLAGTSLVYGFRKAGYEGSPVHTLSFSIGTIVILNDKVVMGFSTYNPIQYYYRNRQYSSLPSAYKIGFLYRYNASLKIHGEIDKELDLPVAVKAGAEYAFGEMFMLRAGMGGLPVSYSFGAAARHRHLLFEVAASSHQYLGFSPCINIRYTFK
jgi:hypothetical protein